MTSPQPRKRTARPPGPTDPALVADAIATLADAGYRAAEAIDHVPARPGLYAIHTAAEVWQLLDLGAAPDARRLYIGKAEKSLQSRDLNVHFRSGKTGWSTVRRSLAARLQRHLDLVACPRSSTLPLASTGLSP
jgi:hypothetical protein